MRKVDVDAGNLFMSKDPFKILGIEPSFDLDHQDLTQRYFILQRTYHPDCREDSKRAPGPSAADINWAYSILKHPLNRAKVLLNMTLLEEMPSLKDVGLLSQSLEDREMLKSLSMLQEIQSFEKEKKNIFHQYMNELTTAFLNKNLDQAKLLVFQMIYLEKLLTETRQRIDQIKGVTHASSDSRT